MPGSAHNTSPQIPFFNDLLDRRYLVNVTQSKRPFLESINLSQVFSIGSHNPHSDLDTRREKLPLLVHFYANPTYFHMKGIIRVTRKWPILVHTNEF